MEDPFSILVKLTLVTFVLEDFNILISGLGTYLIQILAIERVRMDKPVA